METFRATSDQILSTENIYETIYNIERKYGKPASSELNYGLTAEIGRDFFSYLRNFGLTKDPDLLILPPNNHYYFDEKELSGIRTLINLKNLNLIKDLDSFLFSLVRLLPPHANFVGYFLHRKMSFNPDVLFSDLTTRFNNMLDLKTDHNLDEKEIGRKLRRNGFRVIDMTEMRGLTYFYSQNRQADQLSA